MLAVSKLKLLKVSPPAGGLQMMLQMKGLMTLLKEVSRCKQFESQAAQEDWSNTIKQIMVSSSLSS